MTEPTAKRVEGVLRRVLGGVVGLVVGLLVGVIGGTLLLGFGDPLLVAIASAAAGGLVVGAVFPGPFLFLASLVGSALSSAT